MASKVVYTMNEIGLFYCTQETSVRKTSWAQNSEGLSHFFFCCKHKMHSQVETCDYLQSLRPRCFGRWWPTNYVWWFANQMARMTSYVFESWMMSLDVNSKSQKQKVLLIMDKYVTHFLEQVRRDESIGLPAL